MLIAADTSPLIAFSGIGRLDILAAAFHHVTIPPEVAAEIASNGKPWPEAAAVRQALKVGEWLSVWQGDFEKIAPAPARLSVADMAAISLAKHLGTTLLMDEKQGRAFAASMGVAVVGSLGVLLRARLRGQLAALKPLITGMENNGIHFARPLIKKILEHAGED